MAEPTTIARPRLIEQELREMAAQRPPYSATQPFNEMYLTLLLEHAATEIEGLRAHLTKTRMSLHQLLGMIAEEPRLTARALNTPHFVNLSEGGPCTGT